VNGPEPTPREVTIPALGVAMESAVLVAWLKRPGDRVEADEPIAEIETDKSTIELVAPVAGFIGAHRYEAGATIPVGVTIALVHDDSRTALLEPDPDAPEPGNGAAALSGPPAAAIGDAGASEPEDGSPRRRPHRMSPRARRLAAEGARPEHLGPAPATRRFRGIIAARVSESWRTIPHFSVTRQIDVEELGAALRDLRAAGGAFTLTDLLLRAHAIALSEAAGTVAAGASDIGLAVASEHGVMIPVVRDVLGHSLEGLAAARAAAVARGRSGRLTPDELELPPSTLSNLGPFAIDSFTGIIAPGQTSLLTVGRVRRVPCMVDERVVGRDVLSATINADHRALDGADVARILAGFATVLEHPQRLTQRGPVRA